MCDKKNLHTILSTSRKDFSGEYLWETCRCTAIKTGNISGDGINFENFFFSKYIYMY